MYQINKGREPDALKDYRKAPEAVYDGPHFTPVKVDIRIALLAEQGHVCAYCMARITIDKMKVEHWACQDDFAEHQLSYANMLGCCTGNEGEKGKNQTCDTKKANSLLKYSPAEPKHRLNEKHYYLVNGEIGSKDLDFNKQLNKVLNLNSTFQNNRLVSNRAAVIATIQRQLNHKQGTRSKDDIRKLMDKVQQKDSNNMFKPFYGTMLLYLAKKC